MRLLDFIQVEFFVDSSCLLIQKFCQVGVLSVFVLVILAMSRRWT